MSKNNDSVHPEAKASTGRALIIRYSITIFGTVLLLYTLCMALITNFSAGLVIVGLFSLAVIAYGVLWEKIRATWLHVAVIGLCLALVAFSGFLFVYGNSDNVHYDEDAVIVLGAGIRGEEVPRTLGNRLDKALEYHTKNPDAIVIVSGGQGPQEDITEALAMERYLIARGFPAEKIFKEEESTSTLENFSFSRRILEQEFPDGYSVAFVTNNFHVYRAERIAQTAGVSASHMGAGIDWYTIPVNYAREMLAVLRLWILPPQPLAAAAIHPYPSDTSLSSIVLE